MQIFSAKNQISSSFWLKIGSHFRHFFVMISVIHEEKKCVDFSILMKNKNHYKVAKIIINKMLLDLIKYDFFIFMDYTIAFILKEFFCDIY